MRDTIKGRIEVDGMPMEIWGDKPVSCYGLFKGNQDHLYSIDFAYDSTVLEGSLLIDATHGAHYQVAILSKKFVGEKLVLKEGVCFKTNRLVTIRRYETSQSSYSLTRTPVDIKTNFPVFLPGVTVSYVDKATRATVLFNRGELLVSSLGGIQNGDVFIFNDDPDSKEWVVTSIDRARYGGVSVCSTEE